MRARLSRRALLGALAVGAGAVPLMKPLGRQLLPKAHAAETGAPRRIILFEHPNGLPGGSSGIPESWYFKPGATYADGVFGHVLAPLAKHRDNMVVIQNLEQKFDADNGTSNHNNYHIQMYTGSAEADKPQPYWGRARNSSIHWEMAEQIGRLTTPSFPYLLTGVQTDVTHMHDQQGNQVRSPPLSPYEVYKSLFAGFMPEGPAVPDQAVLKRLADRKSVLDHVAKDIVEFQKRLGAEDRARAEVQLAAIRTLEQRLTLGLEPGSRPSCEPPSLSEGVRFTDHVSNDVPQLFEMMGDLVVAALACDLSRIVEMSHWGRDDHNATSNWSPVSTAQGWHSLSHLDPNIESYQRAKVWMSEVVAAFADKLAAIPEAGGSMLDNTLLVVGSEHGQDHNGWSMQWCTIGGKNLGVKVGSYLRAGEPKQGGGLEHNRFLVSLCQVMGLPLDRFGGQDPGQGPLEGFAA